MPGLRIAGNSQAELGVFPPHEFHQVINDSDADFEFFSVWWDPDMSERFTARHAEATH